ncbi:MAG: AAA family ATPase [bacterium]|nr:AAA family ATPase [bacterium]
MIVLIASQKGGCGKSTTAANLCALLAQRGEDVVLVDADRQCTAANWALDRTERTDLPKVHCVQKYENIHSTLLDLAQRYGFVVADTGGRDSREMRTGMLAADILIVPLRASQPDLDTLPKMQEVITQAKDLNPKLHVCALLNIAPTNPLVHEVEEAQDYLSDYPKITLLNTVIRDRKIYRDCMSVGSGVVEEDNDKAKAEIETLVQEIGL